MGLILHAGCFSCGYTEQVTYGPVSFGANIFYIPVLIIKQRRLETFNIYKTPRINKNSGDLVNWGEIRKFNKNQIPYTHPLLTQNTDDALYFYGSEDENHPEYNFRISIIKNKCPWCSEYKLTFEVLANSD